MQRADMDFGGILSFPITKSMSNISNTNLQCSLTGLMIMLFDHPWQPNQFI